MSLDKAIAHKKEFRKPYFGAKAVDKTCRNHGTCDWCKDNRLYNTNKQLEYIKYSYIDFNEYYDMYTLKKYGYKSEFENYSDKFIDEYYKLSKIIDEKCQNIWVNDKSFKTWDEYYDYVLGDF